LFLKEIKLKQLKKVVLLTVLGLFCLINSSEAKYNFSAQTSYIHFLGETKLAHLGGGLKMEYVYDEWAGFYVGANYYSKQKYIGIVEAEAFGNTSAFLIDIEVPSSVYFIQTMVGARVYFYGEQDPVVKGDFGFYGIGEFSLLIGTSESEVPLDDPRYVLYSVPESLRGTVKGRFWNYTGSIGAGGEKRIGRPFIYAEAKFNVKIDKANAFSVSTRIPYGLSYFVGIRIPLSSY
jgi:hypothetical protein